MFFSFINAVSSHGYALFADWASGLFKIFVSYQFSLVFHQVKLLWPKCFMCEDSESMGIKALMVFSVRFEQQYLWVFKWMLNKCT